MTIYEYCTAVIVYRVRDVFFRSNFSKYQAHVML